MQNGDGSSNGRIAAGEGRQPLSEVVADCVRRWFQDTLKEAKSGDVNMQVLVSQMYHSGYGVPKDAQKVIFCFKGSYYDFVEVHLCVSP